ncbi:MAG: TonB-dependent receptor plug domain-containing protein [Chitinophagaceae bacterium]
MKKILLLIMSLGAFGQTHAQVVLRDSMSNISLNQVIISGNKFAEKKKNIVQKVDVFSDKSIREANASNMADFLQQTGQVFVQKSQQGGGSPVIRGFEASRIQLSIDGVRHNNAITRAGHLQNSISFDQSSLDRIEVLNGPSSTIHGSDALGGVIAIKTKDPIFGNNARTKITSVNGLMRYATANQEKTVSAGVHIGNRRFASYTQVSFSDFDDLRQGKNGSDSNLLLWKRFTYVDRINGKDSVVKNANPLIQKYSGYSQVDVLQKLQWRRQGGSKHGLNLQYSQSSNIPRYDRLSEQKSGVPSFAEWYYGPQKRSLAAYTFEKNNLTGFFQEVSINVNHQFWQESRFSRKFKSDVLSARTENIHVGGYSVAFRKKQKQHELTVGSDGQFNFLQSEAQGQNLLTQAVTPIDTRYPDGVNRMQLLALFAQHIWKCSNSRWVVNDGLRWSYNRLHSTLVDTAIQFRLPFTTLNQRNAALTGNMGVAFTPNQHWQYSANYSSGFRAPNFDDMTKVFESVAGQRLVVPNTRLKPEFSHNMELGIRHSGTKYWLQGYAYYTLLRNYIVSDRFTYQGQDSVLYDGTLTPVYASQNKAKAFLYGAGIQFNTNYLFGKFISLNGNVQYTRGRIRQDNDLMPLDHIPPITGRFALRYDRNKIMGECFTLFNGNKPLSEYNMGGEDNLVYATPTGTPAWYTLNVRMAYSLTERFTVQGAIENILDRNYRAFASGFSAPGRNVIIALRYRY